jgi:hypothetical protein
MNLATNIIPFRLPFNLLPFYFTTKEDRKAHRIHRNAVSEKVLQALALTDDVEFIYTTFHVENDQYLRVDLDLGLEKPSFTRRYYNFIIFNYFKGINVLVKKNFVQDVQIWLSQEISSDHYIYDRFTIRAQIARVTTCGELLISYDGTSKVLKKTINECDEIQPEHLGYVLQDNQLLRYQNPDDYLVIDNDRAYPVLGLKIYRDLGIPFTQPDKTNKYKKYVPKITEFVANYLNNNVFRSQVSMIQTSFYSLPMTLIGNVKAESNTLIFGNGQIDTDARQGIKNGPFKKSPYTNVHFFFIYHRDSVDAAKKLDKYYRNGLEFFRGLESVIKIRYHTEKNFSITFENITDPLPEIRESIEGKEWKHDVEYFALYLSPFDKHESDRNNRQIYYSLKKLLLEKRIHSQVIVASKMIEKGSDFKYSMLNIAVATLAKLGGVPWRIQSSLKNELVVGVGAFKSNDTGLQYVGSAFSFQNNGEFNEFDCFLRTDTDILAGAIQEAIIKFTLVNSNPERLVIHFFKDMSQKEIQPILNKLHNLGLNIPVFIITINKTESSDIIAWDTDWSSLMPISGTFVRVGKNEYLLFNNTRYGNDHKASDGFPFPVKMRMSCTNKDLLTPPIVRELIDQVYQFSKMYWKSVKQQHLPVTIKYPEMVAEIFPHFETLTLPEFGKDKLWFL